MPNEYNAKDKQSFARHYPKRMSAEVLLDAISQVSGVPTAFGGLPAGTRAIELPDESVGSSFLDTFGRPKRDTPCECERVTDASLEPEPDAPQLQRGPGQALGRRQPRRSCSRRTRGPTPRRSTSSSGPPSAAAASSTETATALEHLAKHAPARKAAYEDIIWALINAKEFQFID